MGNLTTLQAQIFFDRKSGKSQGSTDLHIKNKRGRTLLGYHHDHTNTKSSIKHYYLPKLNRMQEKLLHTNEQQTQRIHNHLRQAQPRRTQMEKNPQKYEKEVNKTREKEPLLPMPTLR